jgi:aryl-alcohol dehydrogenase-like predicted oxidoreductase
MPKNDRPVIFGLWPLAGITSGRVAQQDAMATIRAAIEAGIDRFDTAFSYGYDGESDRLLGQCMGDDRDRFFVIGKVGQRYDAGRQRVVDCSPETLTADCETSLRRIGIDRFDLLMLHAVDPRVDVRVSAEAVADLQRRGLADSVGVCNVTLDQLRAFSEVAVPAAVQLPLNMLQRDSLRELVPHCRGANIEVHVYWVLMKGILAGRISPETTFADDDSRGRYEIYQGHARQRTHRIVDGLRRIADPLGISVAQLSIGWALSQPGVTAALVGAKRAEQIAETASSKPLAPETIAEIDAVIESDHDLTVDTNS